MHTTQQQHRQSVADFPGVLLAFPCIDGLGLGAASALAHSSVEGRSRFLQSSARARAAYSECKNV